MPKNHFDRRIRRGFQRIVLSYAVLGSTWILVTDFLVARSFDFSKGARLAELSKGLFFIGMTSAFLAVLLSRLRHTLVQTFEERQTTRERLAAIVDSPLVGIAVWQKSGALVDANDAFLDMWGFSREQFEAERPTFAQLSPKENREADLACLQNAVAQGEPGPYTKNLLRRDGSLLPVLTGVTPITPDAHEGILFLVDDRERREAVAQRELLLRDLELKVEERTLELRLANYDLEAFAYSVSHDLRAPLRNIDSLAAAVASEQNATSQGAVGIAKIREYVKRMSSIIESLLRLSNVSRTPLAARRVDLSAIVEEIANELRFTSRERIVTFDVEPDIFVQGDPDLLKVAFRNLLENAWKFTANRPDGRISFGCDGSVIWLKDNGLGFVQPPTDAVFRPFSREDHGSVEGTGVGLAIVDRIVRGHGWTISAQANPSGGAEFRIELKPKCADMGTEPVAEPV